MNHFGPNFFLPYNFPSGFLLGFWLFPLLIWSFFWKGLGLWFSSKNDQKYWFIAILILNTVGILEIAYLFYFAKKKLKLDSLLKTK